MVLAAVHRQQADPLHYMDGSDGLTTSQIRSRAMQLQAQHGRLALIVTDYGQLLQDSKGNNSSVEVQTLVSRNLKPWRARSTCRCKSIDRWACAVTSAPSSATFVSPAAENRMPTWSSGFTATSRCTPISRIAAYSS
jgi:hypothetical protein